MMKVISVTLLLLSLLLVPRLVHAQRKKPAPVCTQAAFAAFKPLPKLQYECPEGQADYGEEILKLPARLAAIRKLERSLESLTSAAWWNANVDDLHSCEIHGSAGKLTDEEKQKVNDNDYDLKIFGNHQVRLPVLADPHAPPKQLVGRVNPLPIAFASPKQSAVSNLQSNFELSSNDW